MVGFLCFLVVALPGLCIHAHENKSMDILYVGLLHK